MNNCATCGGLIMEPMKSYGYAGKVCHCTPPVYTQRPVCDHDNDREAFEAFAVKNDLDLDTDDGQYDSPETNVAWVTWQFRDAARFITKHCDLERRVAKLEKDSHSPIIFIEDENGYLKIEQQACAAAVKPVQDDVKIDTCIVCAQGDCCCDPKNQWRKAIQKTVITSTGKTEERERVMRPDGRPTSFPKASPSSPLSEEKAVEVEAIRHALKHAIVKCTTSYPVENIYVPAIVALDTLASHLSDTSAEKARVEGLVEALKPYRYQENETGRAIDKALAEFCEEPQELPTSLTHG